MTSVSSKLSAISAISNNIVGRYLEARHNGSRLISLSLALLFSVIHRSLETLGIFAIPASPNDIEAFRVITGSNSFELDNRLMEKEERTAYVDNSHAYNDRPCPALISLPMCPHAIRVNHRSVDISWKAARVFRIPDLTATVDGLQSSSLIDEKQRDT